MTSEDFSLDHVTVGITIESRVLTPEQISERVGAQPDEMRRLGDPRGRTGKAWNCNVWRIFERKRGAVDVSAHDLLPLCLESFLGRLRPLSNTMREICETEGGEFFIHVNARHVPGIGLEPEALQLLAASGLSLDVDVVLYGDDLNSPATS